MATKGKQVVKTAKKKSFAEITSFKKTFPITYNGEVLFYLEELSSKEKTGLKVKFLSWVQEISEKMTNVEDMSEEEVKDIYNLNLAMIPETLKLCLKSDTYELEGLSDKEIVKTVESCGEEVGLQITKALDEIIMLDLGQLWSTIENKAREGLTENESQYGEFETQE